MRICALQASSDNTRWAADTGPVLVLQERMEHGPLESSHGTTA
jgi:hypothetical protein